MDWTQLLETMLGGENKEIIVTLNKPVRTAKASDPMYDGAYNKGRVLGFKPGVWKSPRTKNTWGGPLHCIKKPRVLVEYSIFNWHGSIHSDWVPVEDCSFEIVNK